VLYDRARIFVQAGAGGDGGVSFRREPYVPRGGPDGGDGGRGGDVVVVCSSSLRDLRELRRRSRYLAGNGAAGSSRASHGGAGAELVLRVPPGTELHGVDGDLAGRSWELLRPGQREVVARGGSGGRGNRRFASSTRRAPRFAERGLVGERGWLELQLKLLADVGLVGLPNAGKSSLLRALSRAQPKVAAYPFTTLEPVLGVVERDGSQLVVADIPGLIEGASEGAGLGDRFLAHVERTGLLVHVVDIGPELDGASADPLEALVDRWRTVERELGAFNPRLAALGRVICLNKIDLVGQERPKQAAQALARAAGVAPERVVAVSAATGAGLERLVEVIFAAYDQPSKEDCQPAGESDGHLQELLGLAGLAGETPAAGTHRLYRPGGIPSFEVERAQDGAFVLRGEQLEQLARRFDLGQPEARSYIEGRLRRAGVVGALAAHGYREGDRVLLDGHELALGGSR